VATNPLQDIHRQAEAEFQPYGDVEIVSTFGEPPAEYAAVRKSCGMMDLPQRGVLELAGKDRLTFLNNLLSNQTYSKETKSGLPAGKGVYAFLLNAKTGRIITDLNVIERGDRTWLELDARLIETLRQTLDRYLFAEQVKMGDRRGEMHEIALHGPRAAAVLASVGVEGIDALLDSMAAKVFDVDAVIWRDDPAAVPGYHVIVPADAARKVWMEFLSRFGPTGGDTKRQLRPIGWAAFNAARIEGGRPLFGIDFDDSILPHETGPLLNRAVSFTKGCYPGQEIVARMHARQQVARRIAGVRVEGGYLPLAGAKFYDDKGNEIGGVTSSTIAPILSNAAIAIGILKRPFFNAGTIVKVPAEGEMRNASVVEMPFVSLNRSEGK
jgi:folate-binding protein YgfZ